MYAAKALIAAEIHAAPDDVVLVENASSGINAVMRSFPWAAGDKILYLNCAYVSAETVGPSLGRPKPWSLFRDSASNRILSLIHI